MTPVLIGPNLFRLAIGLGYNANLAEWVRRELLALLVQLDALTEAQRTTITVNNSRSIDDELAHIDSFIESNPSGSESEVFMHTAYHLGRVSLLIRLVT